MARIRSLKPGFCTSESIAELPIEVRLHFAMLWTYCDDHGRGRDNVKLLKAELWPLDDDVDLERVESWQNLLAEHGRIRRYEKDGKRFFAVENWSEHQHPQKPKASEYPSPDDKKCTPIYIDKTGKSSEAISVQDEDDTPPISIPSVGESRGGYKEGSSCDDSDESTAESDPAPLPVKPQRDELFEVIAQVTNQRLDDLTPTARGPLNKATKELRATGAAPDEVVRRAVEYRTRMPDAALTPMALAKHWPSLASPVRTISKSEAQLARLQMTRGGSSGAA